MAGNINLNAAKDAKNDEYYTQLSDIANELKYYKQHFAGKIVFCNCDDPYESNFFKYFALNFNFLGLKKLIATCYDGSPVADTQLSLFEPTESYGKQQKTRVPHKIVITEVPDVNGDGATDLADVEWLIKNDKNVLTTLQGNGDFRSPECVELLKEADIVVTNPPFSLFREYISQLLDYNKNFLVLGPMNALHYKEIFPVIRDNKMWIGMKSTGSDMLFDVSAEFAEKLKNTKKEGSGYRIIDGEIKGRAAAIWYTNLDIKKRHESLILYAKYSPTKYPTYSNFDGIDVGKVTEIPEDYTGFMGVPDSFLDCYNPEQFELIGIGSGDLAKEIGVKKNYRGRTDIAYVENGKHKCPYSRIIIRKKQ